MLKDYGKYANWDHFFRVLEQYFVDYQDTTAELVAGEGHGARTMRDADVQGLVGILRLVQEIARHSPTNASMMADNTAWHVLESLFGLLACPVPAALKAELLATVTAFAAPGNKDVLVKIWSLLESTQVLLTVPITQPGAPPRDIAFELQEVERAAGTYPETIAFLKLLAEVRTAITVHSGTRTNLVPVCVCVCVWYSKHRCSCSSPPRHRCSLASAAPTVRAASPRTSRLCATWCLCSTTYSPTSTRASGGRSPPPPCSSCTA